MDKKEEQISLFDGPPPTVEEIRRTINQAVSGDPDQDPTPEQWRTFNEKNSMIKLGDYITILPASPLSPEDKERMTGIYQQMRKWATDSKIVLVTPKAPDPKKPYQPTMEQVWSDDAVFQSIIEAPHLRDIESAKNNWPKIKVSENIDEVSFNKFVNPFTEAGQVMIQSGEAIYDLMTGAFVRKEELDKIYGPKPKTPPEKRKLRNACISGHTPEQYAKCELCQRARFYALTSGYHGDMPTEEEVEAYLRKTDLATSEQQADYQLVLKYLGLPQEPTKDDINNFLMRLLWINKLHMWSKRTFSIHYIRHPLSKELITLAPFYAGKSGLVAQLVVKEPFIRKIYEDAVVISAEEMPPFDPKNLIDMISNVSEKKP